MGSKKRSAKAKQVAAFKAGLNDAYSESDPINSAFSREQERTEQTKREREAAKRSKACTSKNRYTTRGDAELAIQSCADHGTSGLHCYKCPYCNGWHLTSHPWE